MLTESWHILGPTTPWSRSTLDSPRASPRAPPARSASTPAAAQMRPAKRRVQPQTLPIEWMLTVPLELIHAASHEYSTGRLPAAKAEAALIASVLGAMSNPQPQPTARRSSSFSPVAKQRHSRSALPSVASASAEAPRDRPLGQRRLAIRGKRVALHPGADSGRRGSEQAGRCQPLQGHRHRVRQWTQARVAGIGSHQPLDDLHCGCAGAGETPARSPGRFGSTAHLRYWRNPGLSSGPAADLL